MEYYHFLPYKIICLKVKTLQYWSKDILNSLSHRVLREILLYLPTSANDHTVLNGNLDAGGHPRLLIIVL